MDWRTRGANDFRAGVMRAAPPQPKGTAAGDAWLAGWDAAEAEDETEAVEEAAKTERRCRNCEWWDIKDPVESADWDTRSPIRSCHCRAVFPHVGDDGKAAWPITKCDHWCAGFELREV